jgi:predicted transcriptional regulator
MKAQDLISDIYPAVNINDKGEKALVRMDFFKVSHIPLVDEEGEYYGIISESEIYDFDLLNKSLSTHKSVLARPYVYGDAHVYEVINIFSKLNISVVPVLNRKDNYIGSLCLCDIVKQIGTLTGSDSPGTVFVLELSANDYSLSQIAQIIEGNDAKVLSLHTTSPEDSTIVEVTVKINTDDFSAIRQTFERYDYTIKEVFSDDENVDDLLEERYQEFMNYLNI